MHTLRQVQYTLRRQGINFTIGCATVDPGTPAYDPSPLKVRSQERRGPIVVVVGKGGGRAFRRTPRGGLPCATRPLPVCHAAAVEQCCPRWTGTYSHLLWYTTRPLLICSLCVKRYCASCTTLWYRTATHCNAWHCTLQRYFKGLGLPYFYESQRIITLASKLGDIDSICSFCSRMKRGRLYVWCGSPADDLTTWLCCMAPWLWFATLGCLVMARLAAQFGCARLAVYGSPCTPAHTMGRAPVPYVWRFLATLCKTDVLVPVPVWVGIHARAAKTTTCLHSGNTWMTWRRAS